MTRLGYIRTAALLKGTLLGLIIAGCAPIAPTAAPPTLTSIPELTATPIAEECPPADPGPVAQTSILIPGPSAGVAPSTAVGERLVMVFTIVDSTCAPVAGVQVNIHHTDAAGVYGPGHGTA